MAEQHSSSFYIFWKVWKMWLIVYFIYRIRIPVLQYRKIFRKVRLRYINVPRAPWNLREFTRFSCQLQVSSARVSHFWDPETQWISITVHAACDPYSIGKLCVKYQFCAIHTADNTDGKVTNVLRMSTVSEKVHRLDPLLTDTVISILTDESHEL